MIDLFRKLKILKKLLNLDSDKLEKLSCLDIGRLESLLNLDISKLTDISSLDIDRLENLCVLDLEKIQDINHCNFSELMHSVNESKKLTIYEKWGQEVIKNAGKHTYFGEDFMVYTTSTKVGSFCSIANKVILGTTQHPKYFLSTHPFTYFDLMKLKEDQRLIKWNYVHPVEVGHDVWIGLNVIVMDGVKIGNGAIIGSSSVVTQDVLPYSIVAGVPAKMISYRFKKEVIDQLLNLKWWELNDDLIVTLNWEDIDLCISQLKQIRNK